MRDYPQDKRLGDLTAAHRAIELKRDTGRADMLLRDFGQKTEKTDDHSPPVRDGDHAKRNARHAYRAY